MSDERETPVEAPGPAGGLPREAPRHEPPLEDAPDTTDTGTPERGTPERGTPERDRDPVPGVAHEPEPDAGNIMPAQDEPGTL